MSGVGNLSADAVGVCAAGNAAGGGGLADIRGEIRARVVGHRQLTDAVLLDLAIRHQGRLATFDSEHSGAVAAGFGPAGCGGDYSGVAMP